MQNRNFKYILKMSTSLLSTTALLPVFEKKLTTTIMKNTSKKIHIAYYTLFVI
jgi:hypothetical protein